jgi:hypothetical protein
MMPPCCAEPGKGVPGVGFEQVILHVFQVRKKRGQALVGDGRVGSVVRGEAHPNGREARHLLQVCVSPSPLRVRR